MALPLDDPELKTSTTASTVEADHGRIETRTATGWAEIDWLQKQHQWPGLKAIGKVVRVRETAEKTTTETAYYLLSRVRSPERLNQVVTAPGNRKQPKLAAGCGHERGSGQNPRMGHEPQNLAVLRHMAIHAMQKEGPKGSLREKFKCAGSEENYLFRLLELF